MTEPHIPTPDELAYLAGRGAIVFERDSEDWQGRVIAAARRDPQGDAALFAGHEPRRDEQIDGAGVEGATGAPDPDELARLAGRGSVAFEDERANTTAAMRIGNAARGPGCHPDPTGAILADMEPGDRIVYNERRDADGMTGTTYVYAEDEED